MAIPVDDFHTLDANLSRTCLPEGLNHWIRQNHDVPVGGVEAMTGTDGP